MRLSITAVTGGVHMCVCLCVSVYVWDSMTERESEREQWLVVYCFWQHTADFHYTAGRFHSTYKLLLITDSYSHCPYISTHTRDKKALESDKMEL